MSKERSRPCLVLLLAVLALSLNILGVVPVGKTSIVLGVVVLTPFIVLFVSAYLHQRGTFSLPDPSFKGIGFSYYDSYRNEDSEIALHTTMHCQKSGLDIRTWAVVRYQLWFGLDGFNLAFVLNLCFLLSI